MKYWYGRNKKGQSFNEFDNKWGDINNDLTEFYFNNNGQIIEFPKNKTYIQYKTASSTIGGGESQIESRTLGFIDGNIKIQLKVDEKSNVIKITNDITSKTT